MGKKEIWKPILVDGKKPNVPYMISSHGRFGVLDMPMSDIAR